MKSLTAVCQTGALMPAINPNGRIARHTPHRGDGDDAEMKMYLSKLKDLVPYVPKNRKLSKLEIIQHVIDYICELQSTLETHADIGSFDAAGALSLNAAVAVAAAASASAQQQQQAEGEEDVRDDEVNDMDETHEEHSALSERLAGDAMRQHHQQQQQLQQQQHSSPAKRHPLVDRKAPNTILPATAANAGPSQHLHQPTPTLQSLSQLPLAATATPHSTQTQSTDKDSWSRQTC